MKKSFVLLVAVCAMFSSLLTQGCRSFTSRNKAPVTPTAEAQMDPAKPQYMEAEEVGKPGTYTRFVEQEGAAEKTYEIETEDGLSGRTGRHISAPPPVLEQKAVPAPVPVVSNGKGAVYIVKKGDILGRIAIQHGVTRKAIIDANNLKNPDKIRVGQKLVIPPRSAVKKSAPAATKTPAAPKAKKQLPAKDGYSVYTVKNGDILGRIAIQHGVKQRDILSANNMTNGDKLKIGQQLYIPKRGTVAAKPAATEKAAPSVTKVPAAPETEIVPEVSAEPVLTSETAIPAPETAEISVLTELDLD